MNDPLRLIFSLSLSGSILSLILFAVKPLIKNRLSKSIQYYVWLVVLFRLVLPFSFEESIMNNMFYQEQTQVGITAREAALPQGDTVSNTDSSVLIPSVGREVAKGTYNNDSDHSRYIRDLLYQNLFYIWLLGVIIVLSFNFAGYLRFSLYLRKSNIPAADEQYRVFNRLLKGQKKVLLARNPFVTTPMLKGIIKPGIIIPDTDYEEEQIKNILLHELSHMRRFDIAIKWMTMLAAAIHWFNPGMYFIKREINRACELACDEAAVKGLSLSEKQAYGDTLIAVAAEHKYPFGVLQATMCEEKENLKERLKSIMNHSKKSRITIAVSVLLLAAAVTGAMLLGASVGDAGTSPPNIYISAEGVSTKEALIGTYSWKYRNVSVESDSDHPANFKYDNENIVSTTSGQQLIIGTQKLKQDKKYDFIIEQFSVYKDKLEIYPDTPEPSFMNGNMYLQAPKETGEYVYSLILNFKNKGIVNYGFVLRVDMATYDLEAITKYKTPYVGDSTKVLGVAGSLPVPDKDFRQQYISMITSRKPYKLSIFYEVKQEDANRREWAIEKPDETINDTLQKNALVVFCMIDNLEEVTFAFRKSRSEGKLEESSYDTAYTFSRAEFEKKYGDLVALGHKPEQLERVLK